MSNNAPQNNQQQAKQAAYSQAGRTMSQAQIQVRGHSDFLTSRLDRISKWVTQGVRPEALVRFALMDMQADTKAAANLRECSKESIYLSLLACAVTGLEPGALKGEAYLVPFAKKAQFMPGWKGLVKQARRTLAIEAIGANVVRERDLFDIDLGTANTLVHKPHLNSRERGPVIGAYAIARMKGGQFEIEWMDRDDLDAIQRVATKRGASPAWTDWEDQMQRKSPIRRLCKRLPLGADYFVAAALEEAEDQMPIIDMETDGEGSRATRSTGSVAEVNSARPANDDVIDVDATEQPSESEQPTEAAPAQAPAQTQAPAAAATTKQAKAPAQASPPPTARSSRYTNRGPAADAKPAEPTPQPTLSGKNEERACDTCGDIILVPVEIPPGAKCETCA